MDPIALKVPDAVRVSGLSRSAIYEAMRTGAIPAKKAGRRTLIRLADLDSYLAGLPAFQAGA